MSITETKTPASKNKITRRQMLRTIATGSVALAAPACQYPAAAENLPGTELASPELLSLCTDHRRAWANVEASVNAADRMHPSYGGAAAENARDMHHDAELDALDLVLKFPVRTLADARAKAAHFLEHNDWLSEDQLEVLLRSITEGQVDAALPSNGHFSGTVSDDAELVAFGVEYEQLTSNNRAMLAKTDPVQVQFIAEVKSRGLDWDRHLAEISALEDELGLGQLYDENGAICDRMSEIEIKARELRPTTFAGLNAKFVIAHGTLGPAYDDDGSRGDQDWDVMMLNEFADELKALASVRT